MAPDEIAKLESEPGPDAEESLIAMLSHGDEWIVMRAAQALGVRLSLRAVPALIQVAQATSERNHLASLKQARTSPDAVAHQAVAFVQYATDVRAMRRAAVVALGRCGATAAVPVLVELLHETGVAAIPEDAAAALAAIGTPEALAAIERHRAP